MIQRSPMQKVVYTKQNMAKWRWSIMEWCSYLYGWQNNNIIKSSRDWSNSCILSYLAIKHSNLDNGREDRWRSNQRCWYQKILPLNKKNPSKHLNENNSAELKNFSFFKNCFQHATIQYTTIQFKSATIQTN